MHSSPLSASPLQEMVCLLGQPVAGNPTQYILERAFAQTGLDWRCLTCEVAAESLADGVRGLRALGFRGGNVAPPHQESMLTLVDQLEPAAQRSGLVNLWSYEEGQLLGDNTIGLALLEALRGRLELAGKRVQLLGAGRVARSLAVELAQAGVAELTVHARSAEAGERFVHWLAERAPFAPRWQPWQGEAIVAADTDLLLHASPLGSHNTAQRVPVGWSLAQSNLVVVDFVAHPFETRFLREARDRGLIWLDGLDMIVQQGGLALRRWAGVDPDRQVMREAGEEYLS